ncbi:MAG: metalloprotease [Waddliaceae bacterium]|nr:metalloprotease [Waddliaceae bacterium]
MLGKKLLSVGDVVDGFVVTKVVDVVELQCLLTELRHNDTGARVLHLGNDDPENLFCLSFRTTPENSHGTAHVLEHTALCGSEKFPVRDPFFSMIRRSLNTFMNAMTGSDFTCYPAASQVPKDFYNLLEVYLDAVFSPTLAPLNFLQEGHRLEFSESSDGIPSELTRCGIVFNEMKGAMSSPDTRLSEALMNALFPDLTYSYNSGGAPKDIPNLTYEELISFHKKFYHPSRCLFFFYGDIPLEKHLSFIEENALNNVDAAEPLPLLPRQQRFSSPVHRVETYPAPPDEDLSDKSLFSMGWLTCSILDQIELLALVVLDIVLMGTDAAPLKLALLKSGLCKQAESYVESEISEAPFVLFIRGCSADDGDALEDLVMSTLRDIVDEGIASNLIDAAIHQIEFQRSEITGDRSPFGLSLFFRSALLEQHGGNAEDGLTIHALFDKLRALTVDPLYLPSLIKKHLLNNSHYARILMVPDRDLEKRDIAEEQENLRAIEASLSDEDRASIVEDSIALKALQESDDDIEVLPKISISDIPSHSKDFPLVKEKGGAIDVYNHSCFTNDIVYADLVFDLPALAVEDLSYAQLFTLLLPQVGCGSRSYAENLEYIQEHTGGVGASLSLNTRADDHTAFMPTLSFSGKALRRKSDKLFSLITEMIRDADFSDATRLKELIIKHHSSLENNINSNALKYAINISCEGLSVGAHIANHWNGVRYLNVIRDIVKNIDSNSLNLVATMERLQETLLCREGSDLIVCCDDATYDDIKGEGFYGLRDIPQRQQSPWCGDYAIPEVPHQGHIISAPVSFTSKAFNTVSYSHPDAPLLGIASFIMNNKVLHKRIREQGGAYGGGSSNNPTAGKFYFYSYRDPNIASTLSAFEESLTSTHRGAFDARDLEEGKLGMIQGLDSPVAPGSRAVAEYSWMRAKKSLQEREAFRSRVLSASKEDIQRVVGEYLIPEFSSSPTVTFSGADLLTKENAVLGDILEIHNV